MISHDSLLLKLPLDELTCKVFSSTYFTCMICLLVQANNTELCWMNASGTSQKVAQWIESEELFDKGTSVLLAISGGKDSVALAYMLKELGYSFALAHMNFQLRGSDSDMDEAFVRALALKLETTCHVERVNTKKETAQGESTQMAARRLRYNWFENLAKSKGYAAIATAHTANDNAETILFNLSQGTGIKGIVGIPAKNNLVRRPLLCLSTEEVLGYLKTKGIEHREDVSNASDAYKRNYIRHHVVPNLQEVNGHLIEHLSAHSTRFREISGYYHEKLEADKKKYWAPTSYGNWQLALAPFLEESYAQNMLVEWLRKLHFSVADLNTIMQSNTGAHIKNTENSLLLIKERAHLTLINNWETTIESFTIDHKESGKVSHVLGSLSWETISSIEQENLKASECTYIDIEKLSSQSLVLTNAQQGDRFTPYGMKGSQLLSDYSVNAKLGHEEKQNLLVLRDQDKIAWVVGHRSSDAYKITSGTKRILKLIWSKKTKSPFPFTENI